MSDEVEPEKEIGLSVPNGAVSRELLIINKRGLHARASAKFVQMVERFNAEVFVTRGNETVGGNSIMGLMMLAAGPGTTVTVAAIGPDGSFTTRGDANAADDTTTVPAPLAFTPATALSPVMTGHRPPRAPKTRGGPATSQVSMHLSIRSAGSWAGKPRRLYRAP